MWRSIPPDVQKIIELAVLGLGQKTLHYYYDGELLSRPYFNQTTMPDEDWARVRQSQFDLYDELAETSPKHKEMLDIIMGYSEEVEENNYFR
jgi:hypothetical protein